MQPEVVRNIYNLSSDSQKQQNNVVDFNQKLYLV